MNADATEEQFIQDADLYRRVVAAVNKALATADPRRVFTDTIESHERTYAPWTVHREGDARAERWNLSYGPVCHILLLDAPADADITLKATSDEPGEVRWWCGSGGTWVGDGIVTPEAFLAWWECAVAASALGEAGAR